MLVLCITVFIFTQFTYYRFSFSLDNPQQRFNKVYCSNCRMPLGVEKTRTLLICFIFVLTSFSRVSDLVRKAYEKNREIRSLGNIPNILRKTMDISQVTPPAKLTQRV